LAHALAGTAPPAVVQQVAAAVSDLYVGRLRRVDGDPRLDTALLVELGRWMVEVGHYRPRRRVECIEDGVAFHAIRSDARYCSPRCRMKAHRRRHK
jgi:hypothetical protein